MELVRDSNRGLLRREAVQWWKATNFSDGHSPVILSHRYTASHPREYQIWHGIASNERI